LTTVERSVVNLDQLKRDIATARSIQELKEIRDKVEALLEYGKKHGWLFDDRHNAAEAILRCERAMGELLKEMPKNEGAKGLGKQYGVRSHHGTALPPKLEDIGITKNESSRCQTIDDLPEETFEQHIAEAKDKRKELTQASVLKLAKQRDLEDKKAERDAEAQAAPTKPLITLASWEVWLPQQEMCDLLITDPPYATDIDDITSFANAWLPLALSKVKRTGRAYVCIGAYPQELQAYLNVQACMPVQQVLVWSYRNTLGPSPLYGYKQNWQAILYFVGEEAPPLDCPIMNEQFSAQEINAPDGRVGNRYHAWQKPDELAERLIRHSTKPGDRVIDCFTGTGTFLLAAHRLGREAYGCDCSEDMLQIAEQRGCEVRQ